MTRTHWYFSNMHCLMSKRMCACVQVVVGELTANFRPNYIVDLGAGLGTSTDYLMRAAPAGASVYAVDLWSAPFAAKVSFWLNTTCRGRGASRTACVLTTTRPCHLNVLQVLQQHGQGDKADSLAALQGDDAYYHTFIVNMWKYKSKEDKVRGQCHTNWTQDWRSRSDTECST